MGSWRGLGTLIACLFLLRPLPSPACPAACHCSAGEVDCTERDLHEVPQNLSANISTLWLGYNFITVLRPGSFPFLPVLLRLSLPHNHLGTIHSQALVGLGALQELDLSNNYLTVLTSETFLPLISLVMLNLGSNRLGELEPKVLYALPQLQVLFLHSNPWVCTCSIQSLWHWLRLCPHPLHPLQVGQAPVSGLRLDLSTVASFRQCRENSLLAQDYAFFLLIGPFSFLHPVSLRGCATPWHPLGTPGCRTAALRGPQPPPQPGRTAAGRKAKPQPRSRTPDGPSAPRVPPGRKRGAK
uniref:LRRNT domain-containing protein n=1 Tax=Apteryx owenii TaxID=8824 RepID=A0A8B9NVN7_APTOW